MAMAQPTYSDVVSASRQLIGVAVETPFIENVPLSHLIEGRAFLKIECMQHTGTFKFRGAYNKISRLDRSIYSGGVVAFGSGNHPQGVALASRMCGIPAVVLMPRDAPPVKIARAIGLGASVQYFDRLRDDREAMAQHLCETRRAMLVPPYDDPLVIAGQGTVAKEIMDDARRGHYDLMRFTSHAAAPDCLRV